MKSNKPILTLIATVALALIGCSRSTPIPEVTSLQSAVKSEDFALNLVGGLIKSGMTDAAALQTEINKPDPNPINHLDIDSDGKRDYVLVKESVAGKQLDFLAHPSGGGDDLHVATATFNLVDGQMVYDANYTSSVVGYNEPQYVYHDTFARDLAFMMWLTQPRPIYYAPVPMGYSYVTRVPHSTFVTTQRSFTTERRINPTPVSTNRLTTDSSRFASRTPAAAERQRATTLSGASKGISNFRANDRSTPKPAGGAFDSRPSRSSMGSSSRSSSPSRSSFGSSSRSSSPSRGSRR